MFSPIKGKQTTFVYGPEIYEKLVSRDHLLYKINESMDFTFINEECCNLYSENKDVRKDIRETDQSLYEKLGGEKTANDDKKVYKLSPEERESKLVSRPLNNGSSLYSLNIFIFLC